MFILYILSSSIKQYDPFVGNGFTKTPSNKYGSIEYNAFKPCEIIDGTAINELKRGVPETIATWNIGDLNMEGGAGQLNTVFSWQLLLDTGIIRNNSKILIQ